MVGVELNYIHGTASRLRRRLAVGRFFPTDVTFDSVDRIVDQRRCSADRLSARAACRARAMPWGSSCLTPSSASRSGRPISSERRRTWTIQVRRRLALRLPRLSRQRHGQCRTAHSSMAIAPALGVDLMLCARPVPARRMGISSASPSNDRYHDQHRPRRPRLQVLISATGAACLDRNRRGCSYAAPVERARMR